MKTRAFLIILSLMWVGLTAQQVSVNIQKSEGNCLLESNCETNSLCYDLVLVIDQPDWQLRSYNIWVKYPSQSLLYYNSDNSCFLENGGDTDNSQFGQYRVGGINGTYLLEEDVKNTFHSFCLEYADANLIKDSSISVGGTALLYNFPFESTITLRNNQTGEILGVHIQEESTIPIEVEHKHSLLVDSGWSGISTYMEPDVTDIEEVMAPFADDLVVMYNLTEGIYSPGTNINTIINWNYKSGYIIKIVDEFNLNICGSEPQNKSINLMAGWNVIPVLDDDFVPVEDVLNKLGDNLVIAKEVAGYRIYYPEFGINSLASLEPGNAYYVNVLQPDQITFPDENEKSLSTNYDFSFEKRSPWGKVSKTPETHVFCVGDNASSLFETGDLIGAFDAQGMCAGVMEVIDNTRAFALSVFGDDHTTDDKDGMNEMEKISFVLFRSSTGEIFNLELSYADHSPGHDEFVANGISIVKGVTINSTGTISNDSFSGITVQIFPNPTRGKSSVEISGVQSIDGKIEITDSRGLLIFENKLLHTGKKSFHEFDFSELSPGVYYLRLSSDTYNNIQKIVVK